MENVHFVSNLDNEELKSIDGGKNLLEYIVHAAGYVFEWGLDYGDVHEVPRPYGMY